MGAPHSVKGRSGRSRVENQSAKPVNNKSPSNRLQIRPPRLSTVSFSYRCASFGGITLPCRSRHVGTRGLLHSRNLGNGYKPLTSSSGRHVLPAKQNHMHYTRIPAVDKSVFRGHGCRPLDLAQGLLGPGQADLGHRLVGHSSNTSLLQTLGKWFA